MYFFSTLSFLKPSSVSVALNCCCSGLSCIRPLSLAGAGFIRYSHIIPLSCFTFSARPSFTKLSQSFSAGATDAPFLSFNVWLKGPWLYRIPPFLAASLFKALYTFFAIPFLRKASFTPTELILILLPTFSAVTSPMVSPSSVSNSYFRVASVSPAFVAAFLNLTFTPPSSATVSSRILSSVISSPSSTRISVAALSWGRPTSSFSSLNVAVTWLPSVSPTPIVLPSVVCWRTSTPSVLVIWTASCLDFLLFLIVFSQSAIWASRAEVSLPALRLRSLRSFISTNSASSSAIGLNTFCLTPIPSLKLLLASSNFCLKAGDGLFISILSNTICSIGVLSKYISICLRLNSFPLTLYSTLVFTRGKGFSGSFPVVIIWFISFLISDSSGP